MKLAIEHVATCDYHAPFNYVIQKLRLTPRNDARQRILDWHLDLPGSCNEQLDAFGNRTHLLCVESEGTEIRIRVHGLVETFSEASLLSEEPISPLVFLRETALTRLSEPLRNLAANHEGSVGHDRESGLLTLADAIVEHIPLVEHSDVHPVVDAATAFATLNGSNASHVHIFLGLCRELKIPARYVSGYVCAPEDNRLSNHAWAEAWVHDIGWVGFDVSRQKAVDSYYLSLAVGMDELDACPIRGVAPEIGLRTLKASAEIQAAQ